MVKLQKPIPKKLGNKPKLDNPIKQKKQKLKKEKSITAVKNTKAELLDSTPIKEAKAAVKPVKQEKQKGKNKKKLIGSGKDIVSPAESPRTEGKIKKKKEGGKKEKLVKNGMAKTAIAEAAIRKEKKTKKEPAQPAPLTKVTKKSAPAKDTLIDSRTKSDPKKPAASAKKESKKATAKTVVTSDATPKTKETPSLVIKKKEEKNKKAAEVDDPADKFKKAKNKKKDLKKKKIAFKKAKLDAKKQPQSETKQKATPSFRFDPIPFDEDKFHAIVNKESFIKVANALKPIVKEEVATKATSIFDDYRYFLQVGSFKIPNCPKRMVKLNLKHSLVEKDDDVLLVVPDLKRGGKIDYEPTKHHYEDMLRFHGVEGITIMPMNQLRKEYSTLEQKRRLCASYEYFMCDGRIVAQVGSMVGKLTQKPRNTFHAVRLNENKNIKSEIEKSMRRTAYRQIAKSNLYSIPIGNHKFTAEELAENTQVVIDQLKKVFPGGLGNIRNLYLRIGLTGTSSLPLFVSMGQAPENTPEVIGPREQRMIKLKNEANEVLSKFSMTKEGILNKLTKAGVEKKRKFQELKAALKEEDTGVAEEKKKKVETEEKKLAKELELPEDEEEGDDDSSDDDDDIVQLGGSSDDDDEEDNEIGNLDNEDAESLSEILENGVDEDDDQVDIQSENEDDDDDDNDNEDDNDDDNDDDEDEEDEEESD